MSLFFISTLYLLFCAQFTPPSLFPLDKCLVPFSNMLVQICYIPEDIV